MSLILQLDDLSFSADDYSFLPGFAFTRSDTTPENDNLIMKFFYNSETYSLKASNGSLIDFDKLFI